MAHRAGVPGLCEYVLHSPLLLAEDGRVILTLLGTHRTEVVASAREDTTSTQHSAASVLGLKRVLGVLSRLSQLVFPSDRDEPDIDDVTMERALRQADADLESGSTAALSRYVDDAMASQTRSSGRGGLWARAAALKSFLPLDTLLGSFFSKPYDGPHTQARRHELASDVWLDVVSVVASTALLGLVRWRQIFDVEASWTAGDHAADAFFRRTMMTGLTWCRSAAGALQHMLPLKGTTSRVLQGGLVAWLGICCTTLVLNLYGLYRLRRSHQAQARDGLWCVLRGWEHEALTLHRSLQYMRTLDVHNRRGNTCACGRRAGDTSSCVCSVHAEEDAGLDVSSCDTAVPIGHHVRRAVHERLHQHMLELLSLTRVLLDDYSIGESLDDPSSYAAANPRFGAMFGVGADEASENEDGASNATITTASLKDMFYEVARLRSQLLRRLCLVYLASGVDDVSVDVRASLERLLTDIAPLLVESSLDGVAAVSTELTVAKALGELEGTGFGPRQDQDMLDHQLRRIRMSPLDRVLERYDVQAPFDRSTALLSSLYELCHDTLPLIAVLHGRLRQYVLAREDDGVVSSLTHAKQQRVRDLAARMAELRSRFDMISSVLDAGLGNMLDDAHLLCGLMTTDKQKASASGKTDSDHDDDGTTAQGDGSSDIRTMTAYEVDPLEEVARQRSMPSGRLEAMAEEQEIQHMPARTESARDAADEAEKRRQHDEEAKRRREFDQMMRFMGELRTAVNQLPPR